MKIRTLAMAVLFAASMWTLTANALTSAKTACCCCDCDKSAVACAACCQGEGCCPGCAECCGK